MVGSMTDEVERTAASTETSTGATTASGAGVAFQTEVRAQREPERMSNGTAVEIRNLALWYGQKQAIGEISLDIPRNRVTALIGPSGCGKSTLLRCITA